MAIFHLHVSTIARGKGKNIISAAAYRRAARIFDEREGRTWNYTAKHDVIHSEIILPENAPAWAQAFITQEKKHEHTGSAALWNLVDAAEKRKDARLAREVEFALPRELSKEEGIVLAQSFVKHSFAKRGMIADFSVHWSEENPHVHVLLTTRELTADGFGQKVRAWNDKALLLSWREQWTELANVTLQSKGFDVRIDHRSYKDRGIDLIPMPHLGKALSEMRERGLQVDRLSEAKDIQVENLDRIAEEPKQLFKKMTAHTPTFSMTDVGEVLAQYINDKGHFDSKIAGVLSSKVLRNLEKFENLEGVSGEGDVILPTVLQEVFDRITHHDGVFSEQHLAKALLPYTDNAEQFAKALIAIKNSEEIVALGIGPDGRDRWTTREFFKLESALSDMADSAAKRNHCVLGAKKIEGALIEHARSTGKFLTKEQGVAVRYLLEPASIRCLVGRAGTGKSFSLGAACLAWESAGLSVEGVTLSGVASTQLQQESGISARTIASFLLAIEQGKHSLSAHSVVVMDEAGMTDSPSLFGVMRAVEQAGAKLVLVGDHAQLQPVGPGASFRALVERLGFAEIETVFRQRDTWQREVTQCLARGDVGPALDAYEKRDAIVCQETAQMAMDSLVADWLASDKSLNQRLILAHRRIDVMALNVHVREARMAAGAISAGHTLITADQQLNISVGDRLLCLKNRRDEHLYNGSLATVTDLQCNETSEIKSLKVKLDSCDAEQWIDTTQYNTLDYGYATTVHKAQGVTVDETFVYAGGYSWNRHLTYVALSRHRNAMRLYWDKVTHKSIEGLRSSLSRLSIKDSVLDFPLAFAERRAINWANQESNWVTQLVERLKTYRELLIGFNRPTVQSTLQSLNKPQASVADPRREVAHYVDLHREVGLAWQTLEGKLLKLGLRTLPRDGQSFDLVNRTEAYQVFRRAQARRDAQAVLVIANESTCQEAIALNKLDVVQLRRAADRHHLREVVAAYQAAIDSGRTVHRDRWAAKIYEDIKAYYPYLETPKETARQLAVYAQAHIRRLILSGLTPAGRAAFYSVESYTKLDRSLGADWAAYTAGGKQDEDLKARIDLNGILRDQLAQRICEKRDLHQAGIDFFLGSRPELAQKRQTRLLQAAKREECRTTLALWQSYADVRASVPRDRLAHKIYTQIKQYYPFIVGDSPKLKAIRDQSRAHERRQFMMALSIQERQAFRRVEYYRTLTRDVAIALSDETRKTDITSLSKARRAVAYSITQDVYGHRKALSYFGIGRVQAANEKALTLAKRRMTQLRAASEKHVRRIEAETAIARYQAAITPLVRSESAVHLLENVRAYYPEIKAKAIDMAVVRREARAYARLQLFAHSTPEERHLFRQADRYKAQRIRAARLYSNVLEKNKPASWALQRAVDLAFNRRDYLASQLLSKAAGDLPVKLATHYGLSIPRLRAEQARYQKRLGDVETFNTAYTQATKQAQVFLTDTTTYGVCRVALSRALQLSRKGILRHEEKVLASIGLDPIKITYQKATLSRLSTEFDAFAQLEPEKVAQSPVPIVEEPAKRYKQSIDFNRLREGLKANAEYVVESCLGKPKKREGSTWRYPDGLVVTMKGEKRGLWYDFQVREGGDLLGLIHRVKTPTMKSAIEFAGQLVGGLPIDTATAIKRPKFVEKKKEERPIRNLGRVLALFEESEPIKKGFLSSTRLAHGYLSEQRQLGEMNLPKNTFRFHKGLRHFLSKQTFPALLIFARDAKGAVCGMQAIYLDKSTGGKAPVSPPKLSLGKISPGAMVQVGKTNNVLYLAEGPETALSIAKAYPDVQVKATFGLSNLKTCALNSQSEKIVICADNDGLKRSRESLKKWSRELALAGKQVTILMPEQEKTDFNDLLKRGGVEAIRAVAERPYWSCDPITTPQLMMSLREVLAESRDRHTPPINKSALAKTREACPDHVLTTHVLPGDSGILEWSYRRESVFEGSRAMKIFSDDGTGFLVPDTQLETLAEGKEVVMEALSDRRGRTVLRGYQPEVREAIAERLGVLSEQYKEHVKQVHGSADGLRAGIIIGEEEIARCEFAVVVSSDWSGFLISKHRLPTGATVGAEVVLGHDVAHGRGVLVRDSDVKEREISKKYVMEL